MLFTNLSKPIATLFILLMLSGCAAWLKPELQHSLIDIEAGDYRLDPEHAVLLFKVDHMGFSKFVGRFNSFNAELNYVPEDITRSSLEATVDMTSVDVNNEKFERALNGSFWLNTKRYPQAYFKTVSAQQLSPQQLRFEGELTFLGETRTIYVDVNVNGAANNLLTSKYTIGFSATAEFNRSDFGLDTFIPTVGDTIELEIHAEFQEGD